MVMAAVKGTVARILGRSLARREGRVFHDEIDGETPSEPHEQPPDLLREAIERGEVRIDDIPISRKADDVLAQATEQAWREAGPSDLDALRMRRLGQRFVDAGEVKERERAGAKDPAFDEGYAQAQRDLRAAAAERVNEKPRRAQPLPMRGQTIIQPGQEPIGADDLLAEVASDARAFQGRPTVTAETAPAQVLRDADEARIRELDGGVRRTVPAPE